MARTFGRRIQELERRTRIIASGDFSPMPLPDRNDEFRDLGQSINDMAQQLAQLQETMEKTERLRLLGQVSGGLAHQLRNGVTGARLALQLHAREVNGHADSEAIDVALRQLNLVEANLQRFLHLGKTDPQAQAPCSLAPLVDEAVCFGWIDGIRKRIDDVAFGWRLRLHEPRCEFSQKIDIDKRHPDFDRVAHAGPIGIAEQLVAHVPTKLHRRNFETR